MGITIETIKEQFPSATNIRRIDAKQLFLFELSARLVLCSYRTVVAIKELGQWQVSPYKYNVTTSKQLNQFMRGRDAVTVSESTWLELLEFANITQ